MSAAVEPAKIATYALEVQIRASRERVWESITNHTNDWWLPDFHMAGENSQVTLDARAGGLWVEQDESGASLLWYTVQMSVPNTSLHLVGHLAPEYGGPATTMLHLALSDAPEGTKLSVTDALVGRFSDSAVRSLSEGWAQLFNGGLKPFAEATP